MEQFIGWIDVDDDTILNLNTGVVIEKGTDDTTREITATITLATGDDVIVTGANALAVLERAAMLAEIGDSAARTIHAKAAEFAAGIPTP